MALPFVKPTVDQIVSSIAEQINALRAASDTHAVKSKAAADKAVAYEVVSDIHTNESARALRIADKLSDLLA